MATPPPRIVGLVALADLVLGLVLALVGVARDDLTLQVVGAAFLVSGGAVLAYVVWTRNQPGAR